MNDQVEQWKKRLRRLDIGGREFYLAEGDLLLEEQQLARFVSASEPPAPPPAGMKELVGILEGGKLVRWRPGTVLSYCFLGGFPAGQAARLAADMREATEAWEAVCGVQFEHLAHLDGAAAKPKEALFCVRYVDAGGEFIAAAFFPNDPAHRREVIIDPSHFTQTTFDPVGVLRHELGHVLGFRHEHIRSQAPALCPKEDLAGTMNLNDYDPQSVMHYFCGGVGSQTLAITEQDRVAAQMVYGPPLAHVLFADP